MLKQIKSVEASRSTVIKEISKNFNTNMSFFLSSSLMLKALEFLANKDFTGKDIPFMHGKTIEYLLKQKVCICETHLASKIGRASCRERV